MVCSGTLRPHVLFPALITGVPSAGTGSAEPAPEEVVESASCRLWLHTATLGTNEGLQKRMRKKCRLERKVWLQGRGRGGQTRGLRDRPARLHWRAHYTRLCLLPWLWRCLLARLAWASSCGHIPGSWASSHGPQILWYPIVLKGGSLLGSVCVTAGNTSPWGCASSKAVSPGSECTSVCQLLAHFLENRGYLF